MMAVWTSSGGWQGIIALGRITSSAFHFREGNSRGSHGGWVCGGLYKRQKNLTKRRLVT